MRYLLIILSITLNFFVYSESVDFRSEYFQAKSKNQQRAILLNWIESSLQTNLIMADSLLRSQKDNIPMFSRDQKFELCIYNILYKLATNSTERVSLKNFQFEERSREYKLLNAFKNSLYENSSDSTEFANIKDIQNQLFRADDKAISSLFLGNHYFNQGNFKKSEVLLINALKHAKRAKIQLLSSVIFNLLSNFYIEIEKYEKAVLYNQKGLDVAVKEGRIFFIAFHNHKLGLIQLKIKNYLRARKYFNNALTSASKINATYLKGKILEDYGSSYTKSLYTNKAIFYYQKSLICFYEVDNKEGVGSVHKNLGKSYLVKNSLNLAEKNFQLSQGFLEEAGNIVKLADLKHSQAELELKKNEFYKAKKLITEAIKLRSSKERNIDLFDSYLLLSEVSAALSEFKSAHTYLKKYTDYQDSLNQIQTKEKLAEISELYESEQKEKKILEQEKELKEKEDLQLIQDQKLENTQLRNRQIVTILIFSIALFISIILILYFSSKQEKLIKLQREVELKQTLLRSQMNPHFIFNSMSIIQSYIYDNDPKNSSKFLINFSRLMRLILENSSKEFISLEVEIEILERYLEIQKKRFEERFDYKILNMSNLDPEKIRIPPMLLQPFIENSLEHGELDKSKNGKIRITYKIENDLLIFVIEDNGIGRQAAMKKKSKSNLNQHNSMAIDITKSRIDLLNNKYKKAGFLYIQDLTEDGRQGTKVRIATPFQINE